MNKFERLTARSPKNNMAYLVNVKKNEQDLDGSYNTLLCVRDAFEKLATYEEILPEIIESLEEVIKALEFLREINLEMFEVLSIDPYGLLNDAKASLAKVKVEDTE